MAELPRHLGKRAEGSGVQVAHDEELDVGRHCPKAADHGESGMRTAIVEQAVSNAILRADGERPGTRQRVNGRAKAQRTLSEAGEE